jgi:type I restriction enzyme M protein
MTKEELKKLEDTLWSTADTLRANSDLKSSEYSTPVLGLIFLRFADNKYSAHEKEINAEFNKRLGTRVEETIDKIAIKKCGFYLQPNARYDYLLNLPEKEDIAKAIKQAMASIEEYKPELKNTLPQDEYFRLVRKPEYRSIPKQLLKNFADIPKNATGDMFGQIYEYFLGNFAMAEGQGGGEFFTPRSVVRLMVQIIEPHNGTVFDPACGSGGMFVQSAQFVESHKQPGKDNSLFVYGQEKTLETVKLAKMNIAVNGLRGDIKQGNTYYEDLHKSFEKFDYVLANPPFNVDDVNLAKVESDRRFNTYGVPRNKGDAKAKDKGAVTVPNANYLWINLFATSLKRNTGRAALVMANSASDARHSEADIRKNLVENNLIYAMLTLPSNMFYTVTLPATLWFFDKGKEDDNILFIDARNIFTQIDRAHREFSDEQIKDIAIISSLHKGNRKAFIGLVDEYFKSGFDSLSENRPKLETVAAKVALFLKENKCKQIPDFAPVLKDITKLIKIYIDYKKLTITAVDKVNTAQKKLAETVAPFFTKLHELLKEVDKEVRHIEKDLSRNKDLKALKSELEELHNEAKASEYFFTHISWLQERFPEAKYEDVTGLCKLAGMDEIKEQEYSLNPGRYVGVVIEEDGKTEEEFISEMLEMNGELEKLNKEARELERVIGKNIRLIAGDE